MFNLNKLHIEGEVIHGRKLFEDAEDPLRLATVMLGAVTGGCAVVVFAFILDKKHDAWMTITGQRDMFLALEQFPCNYIAGFFAQFIQSLYWTGTWQFKRRARDTYEMGIVSAPVYYLVLVTSWMFTVGSSLMTLAIMTPDELPHEKEQGTKTKFFDPWLADNPVWMKKRSYFIVILCALCWFFAQWVFSISVIRVHSFHFWRFTTFAIIFFGSSIRLLIFLEEGIQKVVVYQEFVTAGDTESAKAMLASHVTSSYFQTNCIWFVSMFAFVWYHILDGWDPVAPGWDSERGPSATMQNAIYDQAPYIKVPAEDEAKNAKLAEAIAHEFEHEVQVRHKTVPDHNEGWGVTLGHVKAVFEIDERINFLNDDLKVGFFKKPGKYDAIVRFNASTLAVGRVSLRVYLPREIPESDLLMNDIGEFPGNDGESQPLRSAGEMDKESTPRVADFLFAEDLKEFFCLDVPSTTGMMKFQYKPDDWGRCRWILHTLRSISGLLKMKGLRDRQTERTAVGGCLPSSGMFGKRYFGGLPFRIGPGACKWGLLPRQRDFIGYGDPVDKFSGPNDTKNWIKIAPTIHDRYGVTAEKSLKDEDKVFDFAVQVATDAEFHDINKPDAIWAEDLSPYFGVGTLTIPKGQVMEKCEKEGLQFSVWHNLKEHRPVGPMNNVRHLVYKKAGAMRAKYFGQCPVTKLSMLR